MNKGRLEAFSDGVLAIIITIMVLELKAPEKTNLRALVPIIPVFLSYVLSFIYVAIYWVNHHYILQAIQKVSSATLWANMNLLFWISLVPFSTAWVDENQIEPIPVAFYGFILLMCSIAFRILENTLLKIKENTDSLEHYLAKGRKEKTSILIYFAAMLLAFVHPFISISCYVVAASIWIVPDQKLGRHLNKGE